MNEEYMQKIFQKLNEDENEGKENNYDLVNLFNRIQNSKQLNSYEDSANYESEAITQDKDMSSFDFNLEQKLMDESLEKQLLIKENSRSSDLSRLFISSDPLNSPNSEDFNSDTKLNSLGGISLWQLTAIVFLILILIGKILSYIFLT